MGWGITRRVPPDKKESEIKVSKNKHKITRKVMWKDKPIEERFEKLKGLFNENGESQQEERTDRGGDGQNGASGTGAQEHKTLQGRGNDG